MEEKLELLNKRDDETNYDYIKRIVYGKQVEKTIDIPYEDLSELVFGDGNNFNESEVRKRFYGMKHLIEVLENDKINTKDDGVNTRILSISDLHVPFQLPIKTFRDYVGKIDVLVLNGDLFDQQSISKFTKLYRVNIMEELIQGRKYIIDLIEYLKPKQVFANAGNHEHRFQAYLSKNLDLDVLELMPETVLDLVFDIGFNHYDKRNKTNTWYEPLSKVFGDSIDIVYTKSWWNKVGKTIFVHPFTFSSGMLKTTEKAMQYFLTKDRDFDTIVMAHTHQCGSYTRGGIHLYEQGTCCDISKIHYADGKLYNSQQQGFILVCQDRDGNLIYDKTKLIHI